MKNDKGTSKLSPEERSAWEKQCRDALRRDRPSSTTETSPPPLGRLQIDFRETKGDEWQSSLV